MDFTNATVLLVAVYGVIELVKALYPGYQALPASKSKPVTVLIALVSAQAMIFLVAATVWAHEQVIGNHPLDKLNVASKILAGIMLAGAASGVSQFLGAVKNIGQNVPEKPIAK